MSGTPIAPTLGAALLLAITATLALRHHGTLSLPASPRPMLPAATVAHATRDDLVLRDRPIAIPDHILTERGCLVEPRRWVFPGLSRAGVAARLQRALGDPAAYTLAMASAQCGHDGCAVDAPSAVVEAVRPAERPIFYAELAATQANPAYLFPFRRSVARVSFVASPGLPPAARDVIARTTWTQHGIAHFADLSGACERVHTDVERRALVRAIHLPSTLDVGLRTTPDAVERLVASVPLRARRAVRAALTEAQTRGAESVPLDVLLPAGVRRRAGAWPMAGEETLNCFWTALHFDDDTARARYPTPEIAAAALRARFDRLSDTPARFGDVMAFYRADGGLEHLAVHLLAGIVYTKNGATIAQPWRIVRVEDLVAIDYPQTQRIELWRPRADP